MKVSCHVFYFKGLMFNLGKIGFMESGKQSALVFRVAYSFLLGATLLCILLVVINPEKILQLYPRSGAVVHLYADSIESKGTSAAAWVDRDNSVYECNIGYGVSYPYCGMVIKFKRADSKNYHLLDYFEFGDAEMIDLSSYDGIYVSVEYSGQNHSLYFFARNAEALPRDTSEYDAAPYAHLDFDPRGEKVFIDFSRMQVARWWIDRFDPPQHMRQPKFGHVYEMGIELPALPAEGVHRLKLNRIAAKKSYFSQKQLFLAIAGLISLSCLVLIIQGILKYFSNRYRKENETLRTTMVVDPLTKCLNRLGLEAAVSVAFPLSNSSRVYVMVLDLDHFKKINDTLGHTAGDEVLRKASTVISKELRSDDVFGRWGGEEFVIISRISSADLENMILRLMHALQSISIDGVSEPVKVTMSVGVTEAKVGEPFDSVFKRADEAMYQVKQTGRGSWKLI